MWNIQLPYLYLYFILHIFIFYIYFLLFISIFIVITYQRLIKTEKKIIYLEIYLLGRGNFLSPQQSLYICILSQLAAIHHPLFTPFNVSSTIIQSIFHFQHLPNIVWQRSQASIHNRGVFATNIYQENLDQRPIYVI